MSDKNHHGHHQSSYNHSGGSLAGKESRKRKKKFTLFYKINFFTVLFISLILLYFVILVSAKPKSFPYITQKIKEHLSQNFSDDVVIENSYISFTAHGSFKIMAINVKINKFESFTQKKRGNKTVIQNLLKDINESIDKTFIKIGCNNCTNIINNFFESDVMNNLKLDSKELFEIIENYFIPLSCNIIPYNSYS